MITTAEPRTQKGRATRERLLVCARDIAIANDGHIEIAWVAEAAGVVPSLVNRYFGSKEQLFAEVLAATSATPTILTQENLRSSNLGETIAATLVNITKTEDTPLEGFLIMLHSASSKRAAEIGREQIEKGHQKVMTDALSGDLAPQRAALVLALVAGFQVMRQMIGLSALAEAEPSVLIKVLAPLFQQLIEGTQPGADKRPEGT